MAGSWTQPRKPPDTTLPAIAGTAVVFLALPIFLLQGWRIEGWALGAFLWLAWSVFRSGVGSIRSLADGDERGLALGFVAGLVGLLVHAIGANTFIIVRIMEPFWFFAAVVIALPVLAAQETAAPAHPLRPVRPARHVA